MHNNAALQRPTSRRKTVVRRKDGFTTVVVTKHINVPGSKPVTSRRVVTFSAS